MDNSKKIVISGYYGFNNTGDEAVLDSILKALKKECKGKKLEITVLSNEPDKTSSLYKANAINRWDMKSIYKEIKKCDLLISGGGSLLQDVTSNKTVPYYLLIIKIAQLYKKDVVFYSQGYGPVNKRHNKYLIKRVLNKVDHIFVRDRNSKKALVDIGIKTPTIVVAADPVLGMVVDRQADIRAREIIEKHGSKRKRVGIYLRSWENDQLLIKKTNILTTMLDKAGFDVFLIPMQEPDDAEFLSKITADRLSVHRVVDKLSIEEVFALTGQMDIVIGMRLHALIMATAQGVATVGLSYDPKVDDFMDMIGNEHCFDVNEFDPMDIINSIKKQLEQIDIVEQDIIAKNKLLIEEAYKPAKLINKLLLK
ncbi:MAG: polysaccharide pyruvyl transferase CsaB [Epulopiscium sp.]|nr:polysaccharide pyruvyl transferase CsaB [Candidatus Epulonipiscium sp.]